MYGVRSQGGGGKEPIIASEPLRNLMAPEASTSIMMAISELSSWSWANSFRPQRRIACFAPRCNIHIATCSPVGHGRATRQQGRTNQTLCSTASHHMVSRSLVPMGQMDRQLHLGNAELVTSAIRRMGVDQSSIDRAKNQVYT